MDPILYFLTHSFILHLALAVIACAVGVVAGWWFWGRFEEQSRGLQTELIQVKERLAKLTKEKDDLSRQRDETRSVSTTLQTEQARMKKLLEEQAEQLSARELRWVKAESELADAQKSQEALSEKLARELAQARREHAQMEGSKAGLQTEVQELRKAAAGNGQLTAETTAARESLIQERDEARRYSDRLEEEITSLRDKLATLNEGRGELLNSRADMQAQLTRLAAELSRSESDLERLQAPLTSPAPTVHSVPTPPLPAGTEVGPVQTSFLS